MSMAANYDKRPAVAVPGFAGHAVQGWPAVIERLRGGLAGGRRTGVVECHPGVDAADIAQRLRAGMPETAVWSTRAVFRGEAEIEQLVAPLLGGGDPVFGRMGALEIDAFLDPEKVRALRVGMAAERRPGWLVGPGASAIWPEAEVLVQAGLPRWEAQQRQRRNASPNLGASNAHERPSLTYKRAFFVDWRVYDRIKLRTQARWDFLLETVNPDDPRLVTGEALRAGWRHVTTRPFRVVPFFDPGPWGGQWMKRMCGLDPAAPNYAWGFDCVPEENSLRLTFDGVTLELPAQSLVFAEPEALLGREVQARFGPEFPIRFDLLDTMGGGNLSFQVHPTADYMRDQFGLGYTQDESYYLLDAEPGAEMYLGRRAGTERNDMMAALREAQRGGAPFPSERFAATFPARRHDHFLIPAGTLHCAGAGCVVLEISATPYIFTFKLWDWGRLGLDGRPRPVHLEHGERVIRWERDENFARRELINRIRAAGAGAGWREEITGLHETQFIETRRHWFTGAVDHDTGGGVNVLNLVQGDAAVVESPDGAFAPFEVHYAETFIVPAAVGAYRIRPAGKSGAEHATVKARVRPSPEGVA